MQDLMAMATNQTPRAPGSKLGNASVSTAEGALTRLSGVSKGLPRWHIHFLLLIISQDPKVRVAG